MTKKTLTLLLALVLVFVLVACGSNNTPAEQSSQKEEGTKQEASSADEVAKFFKGKTIDFIVPYSPGGGYDTVARDLAPYLEKYTGATVLVKNITGGSGNVGNNTIYKSKPDGLTIGILNGGGVVQGQLLDAKGIVKMEGMEFDVTKFSYLGRVNAEPKVFYTSPNSKKISTFEDVVNAKETLVSGATGAQEDVALMQMGLKAAFNLPLRFVFGYEGMSNVELAVMSGELDLSAGSAPSRLPKFKDGDLKPLLVVGGVFPPLSDVPQAIDLATDPEAKKIIQSLDAVVMAGRPIAAPPGLPEEIRQFLEDALKQSLEDPALVEQFEKTGRPIDWIAGNDFKTDVIDKVFSETPQVLFDVWKEELGKK